MTFILLTRPIEKDLNPLLKVGDTVSPSPLLDASQGIHLVAFLRHVGCPFAELMIKRLKEWSMQYPSVTVSIVSHGDEKTTHHWLKAIGGADQMSIIIDPDRNLHSQWGIGLSKLGHFIHPRPLWNVIKLIVTKGIRNRRASGTRWQPSAVFLLKQGQVEWRHTADSAEDITLPSLECVSALM